MSAINPVFFTQTKEWNPFQTSYEPVCALSFLKSCRHKRERAETPLRHFQHALVSIEQNSRKISFLSDGRRCLPIVLPTGYHPPRRCSRWSCQPS